MKNDPNIWRHVAPLDNIWYQKKKQCTEKANGELV